VSRVVLVIIVGAYAVVVIANLAAVVVIANLAAVVIILDSPTSCFERQLQLLVAFLVREQWQSWL
jgi:hypothetical protein